MKNVKYTLRPVAEIRDMVNEFEALKANLYAAAHGGEPDSAGMRQVKALEKAWRDMMWEINTWNDPATGNAISVIFPAVRRDDGRLPKVVESLHAMLREHFGEGIWFVSRKNAGAIVKRIQDITAAAKTVRPTGEPAV